MEHMAGEQQAPGDLVAIYSDPGVGKTKHAAGFCLELWRWTGKTVFYADVEHGGRSLPQDLVVQAPEEFGKKPIYRWTPTAGKHPVDTSYEITKLIGELDVSGGVVDTITHLGGGVLRETSRTNLKASGSDSARAGYVTAGGNSVYSASQLDYGIAQGWLENWIRDVWNVTAQGKWVMLVGHAKVAEIRDAGVAKEMFGGIGLGVGSKPTRTVAGIMQALLRLTVEKQSAAHQPMRVLKVDKDSVWDAKDRYMALPRRGVNIDVSAYDSNDKPKDATVFDREIVEKGAAVWRAIFKRSGLIPAKDSAMAQEGKAK